jgi:Leucine-rich repeat (LRR) protein
MKNLILNLLIVLFILFNVESKAQDFVGLMQQGKIYYNQKNYLSAYERFVQAYGIASSEIEKKDSETWKGNSLKYLQKQYNEMEETIKSSNSELKKANYILGTLYFYDNRIGLAYKDQKYGFIDKKGQTVIAFNYDEAGYFDPFSGFARVSRENIQYLVDTLGNEYPLATNIATINGSTVAIDLRNQYLNSIPQQVFNCNSLKVLLLGNNELKTIPAEISRLKNLMFLDLSNNKLNVLPEEIGFLLKLEQLSLSNNQLGTLPDNFSHLQNLKELKIDNNNLFILPKEFGNLGSLKFLNLNKNKLKNIPPEMCKLYDLETLYLQNNEIGEIAFEIGNLNNLASVFLDENKILDLPQSINRMKNLKKLSVSRNRIINVPVELKSLKGLLEFDLRGNRIPDGKKGMIKSWFPECKLEM